MRVDTKHPLSQYIEVRLDGELMKWAVAADTDEGWVDVMNVQTLPKGLVRPVVNKDTGGFELEHRVGLVQLFDKRTYTMLTEEPK